ncbi:hypothetical protein F8M41_010223 [Gigaspora margarita]|uniref:Uncharacterized protein n=1 Tax=Gigaspora margarita TaxID=4874 RepID=A0A8H3X3U9_GIGMA|nr:hypothetical protein F8M41_010223 [Gigaspora margarita]
MPNLPQDNYDIQLTASEKLINEEVKNLIKIIRDLRKENQRLKKKVQEFEEEREREQEEEERERETFDRQDERDYIIVID